MNQIIVPDVANDVMKKGLGTQFPPYVNLLNAKSPKVEGPINQKYKQWIDEFVVIDGEKPMVHLGEEEFDAVIVAFRLKAMAWTEKETMSAFWPGTVDSNADEALYEEIQAHERDKDKIFRQHGPEYLIWIPSIERFATYHFGSWTGRKYGGTQAYELIKEGKNNVTFFRHWHERGQFPRWVACCKEMEGEPSIIPSEEDCEEQVRLFRNPPKFSKETEEAAPSDR